MKSKKIDRSGINNGRYEHGMCESKLYNIWRGMKDRCYSLKRHDAKYYRLKGIAVCRDWMVFKNFMLWAIDNGYTPGLSLDRKDSKKGYGPKNCRFIPLKHQTRNIGIRTCNTSGFIGVSMLSNGKYKAGIGINRKSKWIGQYDTAISAAKARDKYIIDNKLSNYKLNAI
ncbi:MAG: hypothetical protein QOA70_06870 [Nitrososphaeraceae archaeon]|nr:hypothetical protein [Nitrososphaeraceae archaeon]